MLGFGLRCGGAVDGYLQRSIDRGDGQSCYAVFFLAAFLLLGEIPGRSRFLPVEIHGLSTPVAVLRLAVSPRLDRKLTARRSDIEKVKPVVFPVRRVLPSSLQGAGLDGAGCGRGLNRRSGGVPAGMVQREEDNAADRQNRSEEHKSEL